MPTYTRRPLLARTLDSLRRQLAGPVRYEVIVADNNSVDDTRELVAECARSWPALRYVFEPRRGVSHARNAGIAVASASIIAFIDDDVEADRRWIANIKAAFDAYPEIDCVGGRIDGRWSAPCPSWLTPRHWGAVALQGQKGTTPYVDVDHASPCLMTANFAVRRAAIEEVGGFSPDFLRDEDRELQMRLWDAGKRGLYVGEIAVTTEVPPERLTKAYHRQFNARVGASHARMQYLDRLDRDGRLLHAPARTSTLLGTPGFLYRALLWHITRWIVLLIGLQWDRAFFHETRARYFAGYIWQRSFRDHRRPWTLPMELPRFLATIVARRMRRVASSANADVGTFQP